uniref:Beta-defensin-like domain-containing protein n=1 Tax=Chrysemys picta bellii TaxID=8478 RepID=A0A8C3I5E0_CHRPI
MKILYLLFAVLFLVLQSIPGFTCSPGATMRCLQNGGRCYPWQCPPNTYNIGRCCPWRLCCRRVS